MRSSARSGGPRCWSSSSTIAPPDAPSSRSATVGSVLNVAADVDVGLAVGPVDDAARRAHVVVGDRADDVGQREARGRQRFGIDVDLNRRRDRAVGFDERHAWNLFERRDDLVDRRATRGRPAPSDASSHVSETTTAWLGIVDRDRAASAGRSAVAAARSGRGLALARDRCSDRSSARSARRSWPVRAESRSRVALQIGRAGDLILERAHDRVAHLGRRGARIRAAAPESSERRSSGNCCLTSTTPARDPASRTSATKTVTSVGRRTKSRSDPCALTSTSAPARFAAGDGLRRASGRSGGPGAKRTNATGTSNSVSSSELVRPPITTMPSARREPRSGIERQRDRQHAGDHRRRRHDDRAEAFVRRSRAIAATRSMPARTFSVRELDEQDAVLAHEADEHHRPDQREQVERLAASARARRTRRPRRPASRT